MIGCDDPSDCSGYGYFTAAFKANPNFNTPVTGANDIALIRTTKPIAVPGASTVIIRMFIASHLMIRSVCNGIFIVDSTCSPTA